MFVVGITMVGKLSRVFKNGEDGEEEEEKRKKRNSI